MKLYLSILTFTIIFCFELNGQYKIDKEVYDYRDYHYQEGEPVNIQLCGISSFFIPGLGHFFAREFSRGSKFLGAYSGCFIVLTTGSLAMMGGGTGEGLMWIGGLGMIAVNIWSIIDATRVAKVYNMAFMNKHAVQMSLKLQPIYSPGLSSNTFENSIGISLNVNF